MKILAFIMALILILCCLTGCDKSFGLGRAFVYSNVPFRYPLSQWEDGRFTLYIFGNGQFGVLAIDNPNGIFIEDEQEETDIYYTVFYPECSMGIFKLEDLPSDVAYDLRSNTPIDYSIDVFREIDIAEYNLNLHVKGTCRASKTTAATLKLPSEIYFELVETNISEEDIPY